MNYSIIIYIIGMILEIEAVFMTLPAITALIYQETSGVAFLITIALCLVTCPCFSPSEKPASYSAFRNFFLKLSKNSLEK